jgi:hypothetical protein
LFYTWIHLVTPGSCWAWIPIYSYSGILRNFTTMLLILLPCSLGCDLLTSFSHLYLLLNKYFQIFFISVTSWHFGTLLGNIYSYSIIHFFSALDQGLRKDSAHWSCLVFYTGTSLEYRVVQIILLMAVWLWFIQCWGMVLVLITMSMKIL